jgi:hypothetical protein
MEQKMKELLGKVVATSMNVNDDTICLYYDDVLTIDQALDILRADLQTAKTYRDAWFDRYNDEPIPKRGFPNTDQGMEEYAKARQLVDPYFGINGEPKKLR